jgi:hypothetical protein
MIKTGESEASLILSDPQEFVNLAIDCCDKQKSMTVKTQACKLFESMCDNIDGSTTFVTTFCCNAINSAFARMSGTTPVMDEEGLWGMD